ncbi:MAG: hypothetical protein SFU91_11515 [Chloroherpetonaceae bacterium]|nr:hypothetical protein [Chloroherpetonaceae bacterium]
MKTGDIGQISGEELKFKLENPNEGIFYMPPTAPKPKSRASHDGRKGFCSLIIRRVSRREIIRWKCGGLNADKEAIYGFATMITVSMLN